MFTHLDDPNPAPPGPEQRAAVTRRIQQLRRRRRTITATVALVVAVATATTAAAATGGTGATRVAVGGHSSSPSTTQASTPAGPAVAKDPAVIAVVQQQHFELINAATGKVVRHLAPAVGSVSLSPDGQQVYFERANGHLDPFPIDRMATNGGPVTHIADGQQPAVSPDGTRLAYEAGNGHAVVIQTLATGRRRTIDLARLIGPGASFNNTPNILVWISDHQLVAIPPGDATGGVAGVTTTTVTSPPGTCSALYDQRRQCAIVIDLNATQPAHLLTLPVPKYYSIETAGPGPVGGQLLLGGGSEGPAILRFNVTDTTATLIGHVNMPGQPLVVGFSPTGRHVLYLRNHGPVQLWAGRISTTTVIPTTELIANANLGTVSW